MSLVGSFFQFLEFHPWLRNSPNVFSASHPTCQDKDENFFVNYVLVNDDTRVFILPFEEEDMEISLNDAACIFESTEGEIITSVDYFIQCFNTGNDSSPVRNHPTRSRL